MIEQLPLLSVNALSISFGHSQHSFVAVREVNFAIKAGQVLAIVGESGSGKSLIALSLMGLLPQKAQVTGHINWRQQQKLYSLLQLNSAQWNKLRSSAIGIIFQEPMSALNPVQCIGLQIQEAITMHQNMNRKQAKQKTIEWMTKVKLPNPERLYYRFPHQLSGGQKQRVLIAMAMCNKPQLIIADEPTTALDASVQQEIVQLMQSLQREHQMAMIFITHDLSLAAEVADDILVMNKGQAVEYASAQTIFKQPKQLYTLALLACRPDLRNRGKKLPSVEDYISGRFKEELLPQQLVTDELVLELNELTIGYPIRKQFLGQTTQLFKAVQEVSFTIKKGSTVGLVGESGCGKSTLGKAIVGLIPIHSGRIKVGARQIDCHSGSEVWKFIRQNVQLIFQDPYASLNPRKCIKDIITEPIVVNGLGKGKDLSKEAKRLLDWVQLPEYALERYPHQFSGGQRQRIGIARALALTPQILVCDESVSALDVSVQAQILNLLKSLQQELGLSYLFISHDLSVVHYMSDQVMVMEHGKIVESGSADDILLRPKHTYTQKLIAAMPKNLLLDS